MANSEVWDAFGTPVGVPTPDSFLEIEANLTALGHDTEFTAIQVRTPGDISLGCFRRMGYWAPILNLRGGN
jgi:hypothetical protein